MSRTLLLFGFLGAAVASATVPGCSSQGSDCAANKNCTNPPDSGAGAGGTSGNATGGSGGNNGGTTGGSSGAGGTAPCSGTCGGTTPVCDTVSNTCVECADNGDCAAPTPACNIAAHTCVACTENTDCPSATPFCDTTAHACAECLSSGDCTDAAAARCDAGQCKPCTAKSDCSHISGKTACDTGSGQCVQCTGTDYTACGTDSATSTPLVCDSLNHTCTTNKERSSGLCGACVSDAQCPLGQMCVLEKFGTPQQDVGYFCFWTQGGGNGAPTDCPTEGRPYVKTTTNATSIDGITADICTLRVSTCTAKNEFSAKTCTSTTDNTSCGFDSPNDAKCDVFGAGFRCTMTCLSADDCPGTALDACNTLVNPGVCKLQ